MWAARRASAFSGRPALGISPPAHAPIRFELWAVRLRASPGAARFEQGRGARRMAAPLLGPPSLEGDPGVRIGAARVSGGPRPADSSLPEQRNQRPGEALRIRLGPHPITHAHGRSPIGSPTRLFFPSLRGRSGARKFGWLKPRNPRAARIPGSGHSSAGSHRGSGCWLDRRQPAPRRRSCSGESSQQARAHWKPRSTGPRLRWRREGGRRCPHRAHRSAPHVLYPLVPPRC